MPTRPGRALSVDLRASVGRRVPAPSRAAFHRALTEPDERGTLGHARLGSSNPDLGVRARHLSRRRRAHAAWWPNRGRAQSAERSTTVCSQVDVGRIKRKVTPRNRCASPGEKYPFSLAGTLYSWASTVCPTSPTTKALTNFSHLDTPTAAPPSVEFTTNICSKDGPAAPMHF